LDTQKIRLSAPLLCFLFGFNTACEPADSVVLVAGSVVVDSPHNIEMVYVPAGSFMMGAENADDEMPVHEVSLDSFYVGKYEITQRQWREVMGTNPSTYTGEDHPIESVSWDDAQAFAQILSERTGRRYRLPTEAEWEYAARAGSVTDFHFGDDTLALAEYAWFRGNSGGTTHPVGLKQPNAWGLHDVAGNVWEWCQDWWDPEYYERSPSHNPLNETPYLYTSLETGESFSARVARGGSYRGIPAGSESAHRHGGKQDIKRSHVGFRVVREVVP
jgi:formylglycine-generating enzyme required for sulfatase activity